MSMDNSTKHIVYKITSPIHIEGDGARWTYSVPEAQEAYERGFDIDKVDVVRTKVSTGQTVTIGLETDWRGK